MTTIVFYGWPQRLGGANIERYHTGKLLSCEHEIVYLRDNPRPVFEDDAELLEQTRQFATLVDCYAAEERTTWISHNQDAIYIGMCSGAYRNDFPLLCQNQMKHIWVPCMCYSSDIMRFFLAQGYRPRHTVFQSLYQALCFSEVDGLVSSVIHGLYSDLDEPPVSVQIGKTILKLCRADKDKFPEDYWAQCQEIFDRTGYLTRVVGYNDSIEEKLGKPPGCVSVHAPRSLSIAEAFAGCRYIFPGFGACVENWPQVAYEALAHGCTPIFERGRGGSDEMDFAHQVNGMDHFCEHLDRGQVAPQLHLNGLIDSAQYVLDNALVQWLDLIDEVEAI